MLPDPAALGLLDLQWLPEADLGAVSFVQGADHCEYWQFFTRHNQATHPVSSPNFFNNGICAAEGEYAALGLARNKPVVLLTQDRGENGGIFAERIELSSWTGTSWSAAFDASIYYKFPVVNQKPKRSLCFINECGRFKHYAIKIIDSYSVRDRTKVYIYDKHSKYVVHNDESDDCSKSYGKVPGEFFDKNTSALENFGKFAFNSATFQLHLNHEKILGCIGHILYFPNNIGYNWLIDFFVLENKKASPIAAMEFQPERNTVKIVSIKRRR